MTIVLEMLLKEGSKYKFCQLCLIQIGEKKKYLTGKNGKFLSVKKSENSFSRGIFLARTKNLNFLHVFNKEISSKQFQRKKNQFWATHRRLYF